MAAHARRRKSHLGAKRWEHLLVANMYILSYLTISSCGILANNILESPRPPPRHSCCLAYRFSSKTVSIWTNSPVWFWIWRWCIYFHIQKGLNRSICVFCGIHYETWALPENIQLLFPRRICVPAHLLYYFAFDFVCQPICPWSMRLNLQVGFHAPCFVVLFC